MDLDGVAGTGADVDVDAGMGTDAVTVTVATVDRDYGCVALDTWTYPLELLERDRNKKGQKTKEKPWES